MDGSLTDAGWGEAGRTLVASRLSDLVAWCRKIESGNLHIETIHQARVTTRKLRAAATLFGPVLEPARRQELMEHSRGIARGLGPVRDADVLLRHLSTLRPSGDPERARALKFARNRTRLTRQDDLHGMRQATAEFLDWVETARPPLAAKPELLRGPLPVELRRTMVDLLDALESHQHEALGERDLERAHAMRIAAKRLRYTMEMCAKLFPAARTAVYDAGLAAVTHVQAALGHVNDHDVWRRKLRGMARDARQLLQEEPLREGLRQLARRERDCRDARLDRFARWWKRPQQQHLLRALRDTLA